MSAPLISLAIDPRARLLLFDIADDPWYLAMEVQAFDDDVHGRGYLALLARRDGLVDIYRQPGLRLRREPFVIGRGLGEWRETVIDPARLEVHPDGVELEVGFTDAAGRRVEVRIGDRDGTPRRRGTLLAPVGAGIEHPIQFFVVLMRAFDLVRTSGPEPALSIGGVRRTVKPFPGPAWLHHRRFIRYSGHPVIAILNPSHDGPLDPASLGPATEVVAREGETTAAVRFAPAVPDLRALRPGAATRGTWQLDVADERGLTGGTWSVTRTADAAELALEVTEPWRPHDLPASLRFVTTVARVFRQWPATYRWTARVQLDADPPVMRSAWARTTALETKNPYRVPRLPVRRLVAATGILGLVAVAAGVGRRTRRAARG